MIRFPCRCTHMFEVADVEAGGVVQCPKCGRLNDIPTLSDLGSITDDGTYKLDASPRQAELDRLAKLQRTFAKQRTDEEGEDIDLRVTMDQIAKVGADDGAIELVEEVRPSAPKYDPDTGELVRAIEIKREAIIDPASIPMAKAVVGYATGETIGKFDTVRMIAQLFNLPSTIVIFSVFFLHAFLHFLCWTAVMMAFSSILGFFFVAPIYIVGMCLILAHYSNIIDETGPSQRDDLPRLLRNMEWHDDLWGSFVRTSTAIVVCFMPALATIWLPLTPQAHRLTALMLAMAGMFFFPAVFLTTSASGSIINLRPDKVWAVVLATGGKYLVAVVVCIVAISLYAAGFVSTNLLFVQQFVSTAGWPKFLTNWVIGYPTLLVGIYLMHALCWHLGLLYRAHHEEFGWMLQRFIKDPDAPARNFKVLPKAKPRPAPPGTPVPKPVQPLNTPMDAAAAARARLRSTRGGNS